MPSTFTLTDSQVAAVRDALVDTLHRDCDALADLLREDATMVLVDAQTRANQIIELVDIVDHLDHEETR